MKFKFSILFFLLFSNSFAQDWFFQDVHKPVSVIEQNGQLTIENGLVSRTFLLKGSPVCISFKNLVTGQEMLRSVAPEAEITVDGSSYPIAPIALPKQLAYLNQEMIDKLQVEKSVWQYVGFSEETAKPHFSFKANNWSSSSKFPAGKRLIFKYFWKERGLSAAVVYQMFEGLPIIEKWVELSNNGGQAIRVNQIKHEILRMVEEESAVVGDITNMKIPQLITFENNYAFNNSMNYRLSDQATHWRADSAYTSQVNYRLTSPVLVEIYPKKGIGIDLKPNETLTSIRSYEILYDGYDRERQGLIKRKFYKELMPWTNQNPVFMHLVSTDSEQVKKIIDQCAETGYEMVILSFGSGLNMEDVSTENIAKFKALADYAHSKGVKLGGYSLFSSRSINPETDVIDPVTLKSNAGAFFGHAPCLASQWGLEYIQKLKYFLKETGFDLLEHDGPYPGDLCASKNHPGHRDVEDSQWRQLELQKGLYRWCAENGIFVNAPDWYFMDGTNKIALGYREVNFSLTRAEQQILNRQNIFDGLWEKNGTMSWGFVPLTKYQGGGPEAILEPLSEHLSDYERLMLQYYGSGVQACYRGPRLFDTEETKKAVTEIISWYKANRSILNGYLIHLRRANGRDWDGWMMAEKGKGMVFLFNPLKEEISFILDLDISHLGGGNGISVLENGISKKYKASLNKAKIPVKLKAGGVVVLEIGVR